MNVTTGGKERIHDICLLYQRAFRVDPVFIYMLNKPDDKTREQYLYKYFTRLLGAAALNQGIFEEVSDYGAATVIMPPGKKLDNPLTLLPAGLARFLVELDVKACVRMLFEFSSKTDAAKKRGLKGHKRYWYLFAIATSPELEGKGLGSTMLKAIQARAAKDNLPVWLESTTERSLGVYTKNGFERVDPPIVFGKGSHGPDGRPENDGPGVKLWPMVWWPDKSAAPS